MNDDYYYPVDAEDTAVNQENDSPLAKRIPFCGFVLPHNIALFVIIFLSVIALAGQSAGLPLFIATVGEDSGQYFVLFFCSILFNCVFWPTVFVNRKQLTPECIAYPHGKIMLIGLANALNGFALVYATPFVAPSLQVILVNTTIPMTLLFSKALLRKVYETRQLVGAFLVIVGIGFSLTPMWEDPNFKDQGPWYYTLVFALGALPAMVLNVVEEWVFLECPSYDVSYLLAWSSLYQTFFIIAGFAIDMIPGYGPSTNVEDFLTKLEGGFTCFFNPHANSIQSHKCDYSAILGFTFAASYAMAYFLSGLITKYASANLQALVNGITPVVVVFFWWAWPAANSWAGGEPQSTTDVLFNFGSLPFLALGIYLFRSAEQEHKLVERKLSGGLRGQDTAHTIGMLR